MVIWTEGLLILIFVVLIGANAFYLGRRGRRADRRSEAEADQALELDALAAAVHAAQAENKQLRQRLEVLERLATDDDVELARKIEQLKRDQRRGDEDQPGA